MISFLAGLREKLYESGVTVMEVRPGFVDTAMTAHIEKKTLPAKPELVGKDIFKAIQSEKAYVVYTPFFGKYIMLVVKLVPTFIFKKLSL